MPVFSVPVPVPAQEPPVPSQEVWVVEMWMRYEPGSLLGVFSDLGKAQAYVYTLTPAIKLRLTTESNGDLTFTRKPHGGYGYGVSKFFLDQPDR